MYLTGILARCSDFEARMGRLYRSLANRVEGTAPVARLWRELALEDETHADILRRELRALEEDDDTGGFLPEYVERLDRADSALRDLEARARSLATLDEATALALALEQTTLEDLYDDLVIKASPQFKLISERLEATLSKRPAASVRGLPAGRRPLAR